MEATLKGLLADTMRSIFVSTLLQRIKGATGTINTVEIVCGQVR